jgi:tRNA (cmo5U34)-methyltransferase
LRPGALFIMAEKIKCDNKAMESMVTELYYDFKRRNGYSELEISRKREALEKVLRPMSPTSHMKLLKKSGFKSSEILFRWYNFATFVCRK